MMDDETKTNVQSRLRRAAGQVAGIQRMVDEERYCVDVLLQISAARAALAKASKLLLESHVRTCVHDTFAKRNASARDEKIAELVRVFDKSCNC